MRRLLFAVFAWLVLIWAAGCSPGNGRGGTVENGEWKSDSMRVLLREFSAKETYPENPFLNEAGIRYFTEKLQHAQPDKELEYSIWLAIETLFAGQTEAAIEQLGKVKMYAESQTNWPPGIKQEVIRTADEILAISYLRLGEQQNCILLHGQGSCIFPIRGSGVHQLTEGSRKGKEILLRLLEADPTDLSSRWLLNIAAMTLGEHPEGVPEKWRINPGVFDTGSGFPMFKDIAPSLGLDILNLAGGACIDDFNQDGFPDIATSSSRLDQPFRMFFSNGRDGFEEVTEKAGLAGITGGLNFIHADYDNDGFRDIFILRGGWLREAGALPNSLLRNMGDGSFRDVTKTAGLLSFHPCNSATWADFNLDGYLDLFIGNETTEAEKPRYSELYLNKGNGTFEEFSGAAGLSIARFVKGVSAADYDNDGDPDLYLSCYQQDNMLFQNEGNDENGVPQFREITGKAGVTGPVNSFSCFWWDYNNDGWLDLLVDSYLYDSAEIASEYLGERHPERFPSLYRNTGEGSFEEVAEEAGLSRTIFSMGINTADIDNDGFPDFYCGTGNSDLRALFPNLMFRNVEGKKFEDVTISGGFGHLQKGHGISFGDIDNDGDQDIYHNLGGFFSGDTYQNALFENPGNANRWIRLQLEGVQTNRDAIGARVKIRVRSADGIREIYQTVSHGSSFGESSMDLETGLGNAEKIESVEVFWPVSGESQVFSDLEMNKAYRIRERDKSLTEAPLTRIVFEAKKMDTGHAHPH